MVCGGLVRLVIIWLSPKRLILQSQFGARTPTHLFLEQISGKYSFQTLVTTLLNMYLLAALLDNLSEGQNKLKSNPKGSSFQEFQTLFSSQML